MSFSSNIKQELNKNSNLTNKEIVKYELVGYLISGNVSVGEKKIKFATESDYNINRFSKLLANLNIDHAIDVNGKVFYITANKKELTMVTFCQNTITLKEENLKLEFRKAIIRGLFMGGGSINNPENKYHLEMIVANEENLEKVIHILKGYEFNAKPLKTKQRCSIYMKEGQDISNFLAFIGANKAVMKFEQIRVQREMRGKINRLVNCEAANLNKTLNASIEQIEAIKMIQETGRFHLLDEKLKEIALLRLENPDMPLGELGKRLKRPVGKSGVNYRLKKIIEIAKGGK